MQPCLSGVIERYLEAIGSIAATGEDDRFSLACCYYDLKDIFKTFPTKEAFRQYLKGRSTLRG